MDIKDAFAAVGLIVMGAGCWMISPAAALVLVGAIVFALGVWPKR